MSKAMDALHMASKHAYCESGQHIEFFHEDLDAFVCEVLERAAVECEQSEAYRGSVFAQRIRALKPVADNSGNQNES
jgi:hypothetical protein